MDDKTSSLDIGCSDVIGRSAWTRVAGTGAEYLPSLNAKDRMKKEEANDVVQCLLPALAKVKISADKCKVDTSTTQTGNLRADIWISSALHTRRDFEKNLLAIVEAKHRRCELGDTEWRDAMAQGATKAKAQGLGYYIVTNCTDTHRFYNAATDEEISVDGKVVTQLQSPEVLEKIKTQATADNSLIIDKSKSTAAPVSESKFRKSLEKLAHVYRSCGLKKGDDRIDPTVAFVILKYISEAEAIMRMLGNVVKTWGDYGKAGGNFKADITASARDISSGEHGSTYEDFKELVTFNKKLKNEHFKQVYEELSQYHFHGCNFDVFGAIYEEFASQQKKKEFGEFYTRRHITGVIARLLLRNEVSPRELGICDPACGTAGFLTEAFKALRTNYERNGKLNRAAHTRLSEGTFWGFDNDEKSIARAKLNMFLVGDGHTHLHQIPDSLADWQPDEGWKEEKFDYVLANPPMGKYEGEALALKQA